jgi:hypothetical protein
MLLKTNNIIKIDRIIDNDWKKSYWNIIQKSLLVYIYALSYAEFQSFFWQNWSLHGYRMLTDYWNILTWDKVIDKNNKEYKVHKIDKRENWSWHIHFEVILTSKN